MRLNHKSAWELTVATILSAQCTDARRESGYTGVVLRRFPTPKAMAAASLPELEGLIRTTGFFRAKGEEYSGRGAGGDGGVWGEGSADDG